MLNPEYSVFRFVFDNLIYAAVLVSVGVSTGNWAVVAGVAFGWCLLDSVARLVRETRARTELRTMANKKGLKLGWVQSQHPAWRNRH